MPSRRSVPGVFPDCGDSLVTSSTSSESWNAIPMVEPYRVITSTAAGGARGSRAPRPPAGAGGGGRAGDQRGEPAGGRDEGAGLLGQHGQVVVHRVVAGQRPERLAD